MARDGHKSAYPDGYEQGRILKLADQFKNLQGKHMVVVADQPEFSDQEMVETAEHEYDHGKQWDLGGDAGYSGHVNTAQLLGHPAAGKAISALKQNGYDKAKPSEIAAELGVRLMRPGVAEKEFGISAVKANQLRNWYGDLLKQLHGPEKSAPIRELLNRAMGETKRGK